MTARLSDDVVSALLEMAAESQELDPHEAEITDRLEREIKKYEKALNETLKELVRGNAPGQGATLAQLEGPGEAAYLVLMTLRGEGVGIWDDWTQWYSDAEIEEITKFLESKLGKFSDITGGGSLDMAFYDAAYETAGGAERDEESD